MGDPVIDPNTYPVNNKPTELATLSDPKYLLMISMCQKPHYDRSFNLWINCWEAYLAKTGGIAAVRDPEKPPKMTATNARVHHPVAHIQKIVAKNIAKTVIRSMITCPTLSPAPPRTTLPRQFAIPIIDIKNAASILLIPLSIANGTRWYHGTKNAYCAKNCIIYSVWKVRFLFHLGLMIKQ